jgi:hypothetical protein
MIDRPVRSNDVMTLFPRALHLVYLKIKVFLLFSSLIGKLYIAVGKGACAAGRAAGFVRG